MQLSYITTDNGRIYEEGTLCFNDFQLLYWHCPLLFQSPVNRMRFREKNNNGKKRIREWLLE